MKYRAPGARFRAPLFVVGRCAPTATWLFGLAALVVASGCTSEAPVSAIDNALEAGVAADTGGTAAPDASPDGVTNDATSGADAAADVRLDTGAGDAAGRVDGLASDTGAGDGGAVTFACANSEWDHDKNASTPCVPWGTCVAGTYASGAPSKTADRVCAACSSGSFAASANVTSCTAWKTCATGTFVSKAGSSTTDQECSPCTEGTQSTGANQSLCTAIGACAAGTVQTQAATATTPPTCVACAAGEYCAGAATAKVACADGTWDHDGNPATACIAWVDCIAGQRVQSAGSATQNRVCTACGAESFAAGTNVTSCTAWKTCLAGTFVSAVGSATIDRTCSACADGTSTTAANQSQCTSVNACPAGTVQTVAGTANTAPTCVACAAGEYCAGAATAKVTCGADEWDHDGNAATACIARTNCIEGQKVLSAGSTTQNRTCSACTSGTFSTGVNSASCATWKTCDAGTYVSTQGGATNDPQCSPCPQGTQSTSANQSQCTPIGACAAGTVQTVAGTANTAPTCVACAAGEYCAGAATAKVTCGADEWDHDGNAATDCIARTNCIEGQKVLSAGSTTQNRTCSACTSGTFSTDANSASCTTWKTCDAGNYVATAASATNDRTCGSCEPGTYSSVANYPQCLPHPACVAGTEQTQAGTATTGPTCATCSAGNYCAGGTVAKQPCGANEWDDDGNAATACVARLDCTPGQIVVTAGSATLNRTCSTCAAGTHSSATNSTSCMACASGEFSAANAATCTVWTTCTNGKRMVTNGSATADRVCTNCAAGTFNDTPNVTSCGACTAGTYSAAGAASCGLWTPCDPGSYASTAGTVLASPICSACVAGNYCPGGPTGPSTPCPTGSVSSTWDDDGNAATACVAKLDCTPGQYVTSFGSTTQNRTCSDCAAGSFSSGTNAAGCTPCAAGTYSAAAKSAICSPCATGTFNNAPSSTSCDPWTVNCAPGQYVSSAATTQNPVCSDCFNSYSTTQNATTCTPFTDCTGKTYVDPAAPGSTTANRQCLACAGGTAARSVNSTACVSLAAKYVEVVSGASHTCARLDTGAVRCWGSGTYGQLGNGAKPSAQPTPVDVVGITNATRLVAGAFHTCAILADKTAKCWGQGDTGQLGINSWVSQSSPVAVWTSSSDSSPLANVTGLAAGYGFTCALIDDGSTKTAKCWGANDSGQIGNNSTTTQYAPVAVVTSSSDSTPLGNVKSLTAGAYHTCAVIDDGSTKTAKCWGGNSAGQLGNNSTTDPEKTPVAVVTSSSDSTPLANVEEVDSGAYHTCARLGNGTARCWGNGNFGQLGNNSSASPQRAPVAVRTSSSDATPLANVAGLGAGGNQSCAFLTDGTARCWGYGDNGALGNGSTTTQYAPVTVRTSSSDATPLANVKGLAAGGSHNCALLGDDTVKCWGNNSQGELSDGSATPRNAPVSIVNPSFAQSVVAGVATTCMVTSDGTAKCWGYNAQGQVGNNSVSSPQYSLNSVWSSSSDSTPLANVANLTAASKHTCAALFDGTAKCWGFNGNGQLGNNSSSQQTTPVTVLAASSGTTALANVASLTAGYDHTCAGLSDGTVKCWGPGGSGQLGVGTTPSQQAYPDAVVTSSTDSTPLGNVTNVAAGNSHTCARLSDGSVKCWGYNNNGQLGDGTTTQRNAPVAVPSIFGALKVVSGKGNHTCAILSDGTAKCWGNNDYGQLGNAGTSSSQLTPVAIRASSSGTTPLGNITALTMGGLQACARVSDGTVKCWGITQQGRLGNPSASSPQTTPVSVWSSNSDSTPLANVSSVVGGEGHTCAPMINGGLKCWGYNANAQLGDSSQTDRNTPVSVNGY